MESEEYRGSVWVNMPVQATVDRVTLSAYRIAGTDDWAYEIALVVPELVDDSVYHDAGVIAGETLLSSVSPYIDRSDISAAPFERLSNGRKDTAVFIHAPAACDLPSQVVGYIADAQLSCPRCGPDFSPGGKCIVTTYLNRQSKTAGRDKRHK